VCRTCTPCIRNGWDAGGDTNIRCNRLEQSTTEVAAAARSVTTRWIESGRAGSIRHLPSPTAWTARTGGRVIATPKALASTSRASSLGRLPRGRLAPIFCCQCVHSPWSQGPDPTSRLLSVGASDLTAASLCAWLVPSISACTMRRAACASCGWDGMPSLRRSQFTAPSTQLCSEHVSTIDQALLMVTTSEQSTEPQRTCAANALLSLESFAHYFWTTRRVQHETNEHKRHRVHDATVESVGEKCMVPSQQRKRAAALFSRQEMSSFDSVRRLLKRIGTRCDSVALGQQRSVRVAKRSRCHRVRCPLCFNEIEPKGRNRVRLVGQRRARA